MAPFSSFLPLFFGDVLEFSTVFHSPPESELFLVSSGFSVTLFGSLLAPDSLSYWGKVIKDLDNRKEFYSLADNFVKADLAKKGGVVRSEMNKFF